MLTQAILDASDDDLKDALADMSRTIMQLTITLLVLAAFAMAVVGTPDSQLILTDEPMSVPIVGRMPTEIALIIGPVLLVFVRFYLQFYINHWRKLDRERGRRGLDRPIVISPMRDGLLRMGTTAIRYTLVPLAMAAITFKALGTPGVLSFVLICATVFVTILHLLQDLPPKGWLWGPAFLLAGAGVGVMTTPGQKLLPEAVANLLPAPEDVRRNLDLRYADLSDRVLEGRDLRHADLRKARLENSDLGPILFQNEDRERVPTNLSHAKMQAAILTMADLRYANLTKADLNHADLTEVNLFYADLTKAKLIHADLTEAFLFDADLTGADLFRADLTRAELIGTKLNEANLADADLTGANLDYANLTQAYLLNADLTEANLGGANLFRATLTQATLTGADLREANLHEAVLTDADLTEADLTLADLTEADLFHADLTGAALTRADLTRAFLSLTDLTGAKGLTCEQLKSATGWQLAFRDPELACGAEIPDNRDEISETFSLSIE